MGEVLDRSTDDRRKLRRSDDLRREKSKLALAIQPRAKLRLFALKTLDAIYYGAGQGVR
ncbi:MAG: hypothetical protein WAU33_12995 [Candidatus Binataceae bacterium]